MLLTPRPFPLQTLPDELIREVFAHLPQQDRLSLCLVDRKCNRIATKLLYRRIYLNDSNVVRSDYVDLAINWTLLNIPSYLSEEESRQVANAKLEQLIETFHRNKLTVQSVEWIRINWDLDPRLQKTVLFILCNEAVSLQRLENITDPSCNSIIASGAVSSRSVTSFDMAPPNSLPETAVPDRYIPDLTRYLSQRISTHISRMTLFIDPLKLFNHLYPLSAKLQIVDLKLHWRREFFAPAYFQRCLRHPPLAKMSDVFDARTLKVLTVISWNDSLSQRELDMIEDFREFVGLEDLSLISIKQNILVLMGLFTKLTELKRLKLDFLEDLVPQTTKPEIFLSILLNCKKLQFIDMRFEGLDPPIISTDNDRFKITQKCQCDNCIRVFDSIIHKKFFIYPEDSLLSSVQDLAAKDIFTMMKYLSLLPYSKACDHYPSVRTQPMNMDQFVNKMNGNLLAYRRGKRQLTRDVVPTRNTVNGNGNADASGNAGANGDAGANGNGDDEHEEPDECFILPHEPLTRQDVVDCYHAAIHHYQHTYLVFLKEFPQLRFLVLNDIPSVVVEENGERIFQPVFYNCGFKTNLSGWTRKPKKRDPAKDNLFWKVTSLWGY